MLYKILITDDDHDLVEAMKIRFEREGYEVMVAYNGEECLEQARTWRPHLIILDVAMPKMDGYSAVKILKSEEATKNIPIIILTGKDRLEDIFKMEGVKAYFVKPVEYHVLAQKVKTLLGQL